MTGKDSGPSSPAASKANRPTHVQVPTDLPSVSATSLTLWTLIVWHCGKDPTFAVGQTVLQAEMGRGDSGNPGNLRIHLRELEKAGMLVTEQRYVYDKTQNVYQPLKRVRVGDGRSWVNVQTAVLDALQAGQIKAEQFAALVAWLVDSRLQDHWTPEHGGWTDRGVAENAERWGQGASTVRAHRSHLLKLGFLHEQQRPGRTPLTAGPGELPAVSQIPADHAEEPPAPRQDLSDHPAEICGITPPADPARIYRPLLPHPVPEELPQDLPEIKTKSSVPKGTEVTALTARGRTRAASPRIEESPHSVKAGRARAAAPPSKLAWTTLGELPRPWRECELWVRRRLAARLDRALTMCAPGAIVHAVTSYAPDPTMAADNHTVALDFVLGELAGDVKAGHCRTCGHHHQDAASAACGCCAATANAWLVVDATCCLACDAPNATVREGLPLGSAVCDTCWSVELVAA